MARFRNRTALVEPGAEAEEQRLAAPDPDLTRIGQLLLQREAVTTAQLGAALRAGGGDTSPFVDQLLTDGADRFAVLRAISEIHGVESVEGRSVTPNPAVARTIDEKVVRLHQAIPIDEEEGRLVVLTSEPKLANREAVEAAIGRPVRWLVAENLTVRTLIDRTYRSDDQIERLVKAFETTNEQRAAITAARDATDEDTDDTAPVVQVVNRIVTQALRDRASDVHIEPLDDRVRVRFRIDGALHRRLLAPDGHPARPRQPAEDHGRHEHRRAAASAGRPVQPHGRRPRPRRARLAAWRPCAARRCVLRLLDKSRSLHRPRRSSACPRDTYEDFTAS